MSKMIHPPQGREPIARTAHRTAGLLLSISAALLLAPPPAEAAGAAGDPPPELVTDRPDATESAVTVPRGFVQLETGVLLSTESEGERELELFEGPGTLLRVGLSRSLELRLGWSGWVDAELDPGSAGSGGDGVDGLGDADVGAKLALWDERGGRPQAALLAAVSVPVGEEGISSERFDPSILGSFSWTLTDRLSLGTNVGVRWETEETARGRETLVHLAWSGALGIGLTPRLGAFVELFGSEPLESAPEGGNGAAVSADGGLTWLVRPNLQLDLFAGAGLTDEADDRFVGAGLSVRWPR